jgi:hypothetical protein
MGGSQLARWSVGYDSSIVWRQLELRSEHVQSGEQETGKCCRGARKPVRNRQGTDISQ